MIHMKFTEQVAKSLDHDLAELMLNGFVPAADAMLLQMLRLERGRGVVVAPTVQTSVEGWSADGVKWIPAEPGATKGEADNDF